MKQVYLSLDPASVLKHGGTECLHATDLTRFSPYLFFISPLLSCIVFFASSTGLSSARGYPQPETTRLRAPNPARERNDRRRNRTSYRLEEPRVESWRSVEFGVWMVSLLLAHVESKATVKLTSVV